MKSYLRIGLIGLLLGFASSCTSDKRILIPQIPKIFNDPKRYRKLWLKQGHSLKKPQTITKENSTQHKFHPFSYLHSGLTEFLKEIYIHDNKNWNFSERAHTHHNLTFCMAQIIKRLRKKAILHEAAHVRHIALDYLGSNFSKRWKKIAKIKYGTLHRNNQGWKFKYCVPISGGDALTNFGPGNGCVRISGSKTILEDVATFVDHEDYFFRIPRDSRYKEKLSLLYEYKFLSKKQYLKRCTGLEKNARWLKKMRNTSRPKSVLEYFFKKGKSRSLYKK